ncbi:hypothetical protein QEH42_gp276 [Microbacterium phage Pumpernickel]|uniref:Uncharacterized protein n=1 Tax=Microbacterium phage Pumpernickel TaxID=2885983 RepID=A0AAE8YA03_9CAUD|nr:hypothetical protein QEH42_gp276 [Microbacterium phage Pumpernickel]UDL15942.1 hypothetical protein SEA_PUMPERNICKEL_192 [Microbacterium phage Pumpernickel]
MTIENPEQTMQELLRVVEGLAGNVQEEIVFEYMLEQFRSWDEHDKTVMLGTILIELCGAREVINSVITPLAKKISEGDDDPKKDEQTDHGGWEDH